VRRVRACGLVCVLLAFACSHARGEAPASDAGPREQVVLLHGLGRSERSMEPLERHLESTGFEIHNVGYATTDHTVEELVPVIAAEVDACCGGSNRRMHFVTHSLGGIMVRAYLSQQRPANLGRVVMLSPPNHGSELADLVRDSWLAEGTPVHGLGSGPDSVPQRLGPANFEVGVITGNRSWHPLGAWLIDGPSDGVVSVESAKLEGMTDFLVVETTHTTIMHDARVQDQVVRFLRTGAFSHEGETGP
jgi:triacylglycerol lipase